MKRALLIVLLMVMQWSASGQDISRQSERKKQIEEEISFINNQLKNLSSKQKASTAELTLIKKKVANRKKLINGMDAQIKTYNDQIYLKQKEIYRLHKELDTLEMYYNKLILNTYKNRNAKVWFMYILASENIGQGYRRFAYLKNLAGEVNRQGTKIKEKEKEIEDERAKLAEILSETQKAKSERQAEYNKLVSEENASKKAIKTMAKTEKQYRAELQKKRQEVDKLNREIERILNKTIETQKKDNTKIDYALAKEFEKNKGKLPWPIKQGVVIEHFGINEHPVYKNLKLPQNNGVTFSTTRNATVYSVFDGVIKQIVVMPGYSQCVLVQHGTFFTFYCKLSKVKVKSGQKIKTGEAIGTLEEDGKNSSTFHFQIWKGTEKQNPENWIAGL